MIDSEMLAPGAGLKVAVAGPGRLRSSVWRIWGKKSTRDVYLAPLSAAGDFKVSLHEWPVAAVVPRPSGHEVR